MNPPQLDVQQVAYAREVLNLQQKKNEAAIALLNSWLTDESGYDEKAWPIVKQALEENRLSMRRKLHD